MLRPGRRKRDTNAIGEISESAIATRFLQLGYMLLLPYGGNQRYDMMIEDDDGETWRIQCKTAWANKDGTVLTFNTANHNVTGKNKQWRNYRGQCDFFAVYYEPLNKVYLVPVDEIGTVEASLRLAPAKNNQGKHVRWARDYELEDE